MAASVVQYGRRRGSTKQGTSDKEYNGTAEQQQPPDPRMVTILPRAEFHRIQESLNPVNKYEESIRAAAQRREAMHLRSKEVVKFWPNTIAAQRQKKLEAKRVREEREEQQRKMTDIEEAKYQAQKRKDAIEKAKAQQYYQTDRVKGLHSALLLCEVLKERDAQVELKRRIKSTSKDTEQALIDMMNSREDEAFKQEQQRESQRKLARQANAEDLMKQIKEAELARAQEQQDNKEEGEEIQRCRELFLTEQSMERQRQFEQKRSIMHAHLEHISNRDTMRAVERQKQELEDEQLKCFLSAKQKMMKFRKEKEAEMFREAQMRRDMATDKLAAAKQAQIVNEEEKDCSALSWAVAQKDTQQVEQHRNDEERKAATLKALDDQREAKMQEQQRKDAREQEEALNRLHAIKDAEITFFEKQEQRAQKNKENRITLAKLYIDEMAKKCSKAREVRRDQQELEERNAQLIIEDEKQFQHYAKKVIEAAADAERNVLPLHKAAREGIGGGRGPIFSGVRPSYLVQDDSGVQMPRYVCGSTQNIKEFNEAVEIKDARKRLGFAWELNSDD